MVQRQFRKSLVNKLIIVVIMEEYDRGYYDALKWVYDHTGGDNYKLSVKAKMENIIRIINYVSD